MHNNILKHIAIIPDGNRRWAREKGLPTIEGHRRGFEQAKKLAKRSKELGISTLTIWAFSTENWKRSKAEVGYLMNIYERWLDSYLEEVIKDEVRLIHIGRKDRISKSLLDKITNVQKETQKFTRNTLILALDYGGQDEILRAVNQIKISQQKSKNLKIEEFESIMDTGGIPKPDLIIRTGGEKRLSGFLLWSGAYAEFMFIDKYFPDFSTKDLEKCVIEFKKIQRRFGK